jgi:hypothetical protein
MGETANRNGGEIAAASANGDVTADEDTHAISATGG